MFYPRATINLENFRDNIKYIQSLSKSSKIFPVIKANAYGHGYTKIAKILSQESIDTICVATFDEIVEILKEDLNLNILHLGRIILEESIINNRVIFTINSLDDIENINKVCSKINKKMRCHVKVDTGMNRMGCKMNEFNEILELAHRSDFINVEAVYSHLACSENKYSESNKKQILSFNYVRDLTKKYKLKYHLLNSGGILNYPNSAFDYIRVGICIYGVSPLGIINKNLKPVMKLSAPIVLIKNIYKGESVGYGCTYTAKNKTRIAVVQCGYADGIPRDFGNKGCVYFDKYEFPIIGRVSMDLICIDISMLDESIFLKNVIIWGGSQSQSRLEVISKKFNTIPYVYLTGLSNRVKRVYV